ncbi:MAG: hypothetical protein ABL927_09060, partial [Bdellovibrionales bacterium]
MKSIFQKFTTMLIAALMLTAHPTSVVAAPAADHESSREVTREGVWRGIDPSKAQDLLEWATSSKLTLEEGKVAIAKLTVKERGPAYRRLMVRVVESSGTKQNELLMRVSLNRGLEVFDILAATTKATEESESLKRRLLKEAIDLAINVYQDDE